MNQLAAAMRKASTNGTLPRHLVRMVTEAERKIQAEQEELRRRLAAEKEELRLKQELEDKQLEQQCRYDSYHQRINATRRNGLGSMKPCSFTAWPPASPALANGRPCRIRWGLSDGANHAVVVSFEYPQPLVGLDEMTTTLGLVPLGGLEPCDCRGYIHRRGCSPKRGR